MTETWLNVLIYLQSDIKPGVKGMNGSICRCVVPWWWLARSPWTLTFCNAFIFGMCVQPCLPRNYVNVQLICTSKYEENIMWPNYITTTLFKTIRKINVPSKSQKHSQLTMYLNCFPKKAGNLAVPSTCNDYSIIQKSAVTWDILTFTNIFPLSDPKCFCCRSVAMNPGLFGANPALCVPPTM